MAEIKRINGREVLDYLARDYDSLLEAMRARIPEKLPEWTGYSSEADFGNVLLEIFAHMGDILSYYQDRIANESFLGTAQTRRSIIQHLGLIGYRLGTAAPSSATLSLLFPMNVARKAVSVRKGDAFATASQRDRPSVRFEYVGEVDLHIPDPQALDPVRDPSSGQSFRCYGPNPFSPSPGRPATPGIPVEQGRLIADEQLGVSTGLANQRFPLAHAGMILRPAGQDQAANNDLVVLVEDGTRVERWYFRETLAFSRPIPLWDQYQSLPQKHFTVDIDENDRAVLIFGDGSFGGIPPRNASIRATYRVGGGAQGNVPAQSITTVADAPELNLAAAKVINAKPASGGAERESIAHAVAQAPQVFRSRKRAVTREDFKALALAFDGVGKVRAVPSNWNLVTLHVAPAGGGEIDDLLKQKLLAYFEDKRPVNTRIEVKGVDYVEIFVSASLGIEPYYEYREVAARAVAAAGRLLQFAQVDFGQTLHLSKFYEAIEAVDGVDYVNITQFERLPLPCGESSAKILQEGMMKMGDSEIPCIPYRKADYAGYAPGIKVTPSKDGA